MSSESSISQLMKKLESRDAATSEAEIYDRLREYGQNHSSVDDLEKKELLSESMAFGFVEDYQDKDTGWGTYYGPILVSRNEKGEWFESPSIRLVTEEMLDYWRVRLNETSNALMKARYADLIWDFSKKITNRNPDIFYAITVIDQNIEIAKFSLCKYEHAIVKKLERALNLAISLNDKSRISSTLQSIISYEETLLRTGNSNTWGFSFDLLVANKKVQLSKEEEQKIIDRLESRISSSLAIDEKPALDPFLVEEASMRLLSYYKRHADIENANRVLRRYGEAYVSAAKKATPLVATAWLEKVYKVISQNGMKEYANEIAELVRDYSKKSREDLKAFSFAVTIPNEEIEKFLNGITEGTTEETLDRIATYFIPKKDAIEKQVKDLFRKAPLQGLITISVMDEGGRSVAKIGSVENDLVGRIIYQLAQNLQFEDQLLFWALNKAVQKHELDSKKVISYLHRSTLFDREREIILEKGLKAHFSGEYLVSCYLLLPEIEVFLRKLLYLTGGSIYKLHRLGGIMEKTLEDIMHDEAVATVLGPNIITYFSAILTDNRAWNIRNRVCHGLINPNQLGATVSNRLIHCLMVLSFIREQEENQDKK